MTSAHVHAVMNSDSLAGNLLVDAILTGTNVFAFQVHNQQVGKILFHQGVKIRYMWKGKGKLYTEGAKYKSD